MQTAFPFQPSPCLSSVMAIPGARWKTNQHSFLHSPAVIQILFLLTSAINKSRWSKKRLSYVILYLRIPMTVASREQSNWLFSRYGKEKNLSGSYWQGRLCGCNEMLDCLHF